MGFKVLFLFLVTILALEPVYGSVTDELLDIHNLTGRPDSVECKFTPDQLVPLQTQEAHEVVAGFVKAKDAILDNAGLTQIAGQDLTALRAKMAAVKVQMYPRLCEREMVGGIVSYRGSAQWFRLDGGENGIRISLASLAKNSPELMPALSLHEFLGAIGLQDQYYECSSSLFVLARPDVVGSSLTPDEISQVKTYAQQICGRPESRGFEPDVDRVHLASKGGSSSGTGGGGDERAIQSKLIMIFGKLIGLQRLSQMKASSKVRRARGYLLSDLADALNSVNVMGDQDMDGNDDPYKTAAIDRAQLMNTFLSIQNETGGTVTPNLDHPICSFFNGAYCQLGAVK